MSENIFAIFPITNSDNCFSSLHTEDVHNPMNTECVNVTLKLL